MTQKELKQAIDWLNEKLATGGNLNGFQMEQILKVLNEAYGSELDWEEEA